MHLNDDVTITISAGDKCGMPNLLLSGGRVGRSHWAWSSVQGQAEGTVGEMCSLWSVMSAVAQHPLLAVIRLRDPRAHFSQNALIHFINDEKYFIVTFIIERINLDKSAG